MLNNLTGWHFLILLAVVLLVFGAAKLPALAKSAGQSIKIFKGEMKTPGHDEATATVTPVVPADTVVSTETAVPAEPENVTDISARPDAARR
jgi:sec-independent protein translocase protein TatA